MPDTAANSASSDSLLLADDQLGLCLVTGAAGFLGRNIVRGLLDRGLKVRALIRNTALDITHPNLEIIHCDVTDPEGLREACGHVNTVFHTASVMQFLGGRAVTAAYRAWGYKNNVTGTQNVIDACQANGVSRLLYTSSVDVCFDRDTPGELTASSSHSSKPSCVYVETKQIAEKSVLAANAEEGLYTCALRPDGIYGAEENYMIDRFTQQLLSGRLKAKIGGSDIINDNSHVLNLVEAHCLAAVHLGPDSRVNGNAYFVGDNEPMNSFEFFRPLIEGLGYKVPDFSMPAGLLRPIFLLWQYLHFKIGLPEPVLSPHELDKISITHYGSSEAALADFGYKPIISVQEAMVQCLDYCRGRYKK